MRPRCSIAAGLLCLLASMISTPAAGDEGGVKPTAQQRELYEMAFQAYRLNRFEDAVVYLEAAVRIQPFDLLYYSKGRAHFRLGQCVAARDAYLQAAQAPEYEQNSEPMAERVEMATAELEQSCPGELLTTCAVTGVEIEIDDRPAVACGGPVKLSSGSHRVVARLAGKEEVHEISIAPMERTVLEIALEPDPQIVVERVTQPSTPWLPPTLIGVGAALLAGSVAVDVGWLGPAIDQLERMQARPTPRDEIVQLQRRIHVTRASLMGSYSVSTALLATGAALFFFLPTDSSRRATLDVAPGSLSWTLRW